MGIITGNNIIFPALLVLFVFASFSPVLKNQFINFDDNKFIYDNKLIQNDRIEYSPILKEQIFTPNYKPLVYLTWEIEYKLFRNNPAGYHLVNLLLHIFNTILVFLIISLISGYFFRFKNAALPVFLSTIVFALHPLRVESVAWASELKDMLFAFCFFSSLLSYLCYLRDKKSVFLIISLIFFSLGILSKSMIISLPFVLLLIDYLHGRSIKDNYIQEKLPFFVVLCIGLFLYGISLKYIIPLFGLFLAIAWYLQRNPEIKLKHTNVIILPVAAFLCISIFVLWIVNYAGLDTVLIKSSADFALSDQPVINFIIIASCRICFWLMKLIYPFDLAVVYSIPDFLSGRQLAFYTLLFPLSIVVFLSLVFYLFRKNRYVIFVIAYFAITIFPAVFSAPAGTNFLPDRYTYISSLSYSLVLVLLFDRVKNLSLYIYPVLGIYIILLGFKTHSYCRDWKDSISIWTAALEKNETWHAYFNRSQAYFILKDYEKSYSDINRAIEIDSTFSDSYFNRGLNLIPLKNYSRAIEDFDKALKLNPGNSKAISYKAMCLFYLGNYLQAINLCNQALKNEPQDTKTYLTRAVAKEKLRDYEGAIQDFTAIINLEPQNGESYYRRGITRLLNRDTAGSCQDWRKSQSLNFEKATEMINRYCK